jgi:CheY-like chemotaxis protein
MNLQTYITNFVSKVFAGSLSVAILANIFGQNFNPIMVSIMGFFLCIFCIYLYFNKRSNNVSKYFVYIVYVTTIIPYVSMYYGTGPINSLIQFIFVTLILYVIKSTMHAFIFGLININALFFLSMRFLETDHYPFVIEYIIISAIMIIMFKIFNFKQQEASFLKQLLEHDICKLKIDPNKMELIDSANIYTVLGINHDKFSFNVFLNSLTKEEQQLIKNNLFKENTKFIIYFKNRYFKCIMSYVNKGTIISLIDITSEQLHVLELKDKNKKLTSYNEYINQKINKPLHILSGYLEFLKTNINNKEITDEVISNMHRVILDINVKTYDFFKNGLKIKDIPNDIILLYTDFARGNENIRVIHNNRFSSFIHLFDKQLFNKLVDDLFKYINYNFNLSQAKIYINITDQVDIKFVFENIDYADKPTVLRNIQNSEIYDFITFLTRFYHGTIKLNVNEHIIFDMSFDLKKVQKIEQNTLNTVNAHLTNGRLLIVDDSSITVTVTKEYFKEFNMVIDCASSGEEAIKLVNKHDYDIILMDIHMPGIGGIEATQQIRSLGYDKLIYCISGIATVNDYNTLMELGFDDIITKPFNKLKLLNKISEHLNSNIYI